ncbi:MAG: hypothetical protein ABL888_21885 [Pirellulaceae bacterium]
MAAPSRKPRRVFYALPYEEWCALEKATEELWEQEAKRLRQIGLEAFTKEQGHWVIKGMTTNGAVNDEEVMNVCLDIRRSKFHPFSQYLSHLLQFGNE